MGTVTRSMTVVYGSTTIGGTLSGGTLTIHDVHSLNRDQDTFDLSFSVLVTASASSGLATSCQALETAFTTRRQDIKVTIGGADFLDLKHSDNSALNITASISKNGSPHDSALSRLYRISVSGVTTPNSPPQTSNLAFTYGTVTVAGTLSGGALSLYEVHSISRDQDTFTLCASVLVKAANAATLAASCVALETAFTTRRLDLVVTMGGTTILDLKHSDNSALNTTSSIEKQGSPVDSELSRLYMVTVSGEIPTKAALTALRSFNYDITFTPSRKASLTVSGTYTAVVGTAAAAQYLASIDARVSTITTALGGTWEIISETYTPDDTDQVVEFERIYQELIYSSATTLYNLGIRNQTLTVNSDKVGSEGLKDERKLLNITASYSAAVDSTVTKGLSTLWSATIKPYIVAEIIKVAATTKIAIVKQTVGYDSVENRIEASMEARARNASDTIAHTVSATDDIDMGVIIARVWPDKEIEGIRTGTKAYVYQGPKVISRTISETTTKLGIPTMPGPASGGGDLHPNAGGAAAEQIASLKVTGGVLTKYSEAQTPKSLGVVGYQLGIVDITKTWVWEFFEEEGAEGTVGSTVSPSGPRGDHYFVPA